MRLCTLQPRPTLLGLALALLPFTLVQPSWAVTDPGTGLDYSSVEDSLPAECRTELARELALISVHSNDPLMEANFELANYCGQKMIEAMQALEESTGYNAFAAADVVVARTLQGEGLINFESPHVHPIDLTPDGSTVLAVNTAAHRLEVFRVSGSTLVHRTSIPVGIDPVSVRARSNGEAWVVNHLSDSVSVVDLNRETVVRTLFTDNEPADVVFANGRAFVSASESNRLNVFNLSNLSAAPSDVVINGEDPRALAVSRDGSTVFAAVFESGNNTGIQARSGFSGGGNIVRGVGLADNDVALVNTSTLNVSYRRGLMNMVMAITVNQQNGEVVVVGTEATNEVANEPVLNGKFLRVNLAAFSGAGSSGATLTDLNAHLDYQTASVSSSLRSRSIGDPRGIAFRADGQRAFITGMGSNNVIVTDNRGNRITRFGVGEGPTGIALGNEQGYVMNKFDGSISVIDTTNFAELDRVAFYDPTSDAIRDGRRFLYDTHYTSGTGHVSCGSCHVDGRTDRLGWDLSDPSAPNRTINRASNFLPGNVIGTWNVSGMKDVMVTQTLMDITEHPVLHWRGDRDGLEEFNATYTNLMGRASQITDAEMAAFKAFLDTTWLPPNPYRRIDNSRPQTVTLPDGSTATSTRVGTGLTEALRGGGNTNNCLACHSGQGNATRNFGANDEIGSTIVAPALPALYDKMGFTFGRSGFGFFHNGATDLFEATRTREFLAEIFTLEGPDGPLVGAERRKAPHAGFGQQITLNGVMSTAERNRLSQLFNIANGSQWVELIAQARIDNEPRGFLLNSGTSFTADKSGETSSRSELEQLAANGTPVTFTLVANNMGRRVALDLNNNGVLDGDELPRPTCGEPSIDAAIDKALFAWANCDGRVQIVGAGGNAYASYVGRIASNSALSALSENGIESSDSIVLSSDQQQISFDIGLGGIWTDDFAFTPSEGSELCMIVSERTSGSSVLAGPNRTPVSGAFNPVTLASCTMPPPPGDEGGDEIVCGDPRIDPAVDGGVYVWQNCGGSWNLLLTGKSGQGSSSVAGVIAASGSVSNLVDVSIESSDSFAASAVNRAVFDLTTGSPWSDQIRFDASGEVCIALGELTSGFDVALGRDRVALTSVNLDGSNGFNPATGAACALPGGGGATCGDPGVDLATEEGFFIWKRCDGEWVVMMTGVVARSGQGVRYDATITSSAGFESLTPLKMESSDVLDLNGNTLSIDAATGHPWEDRFSFSVPSTASLCVTINSMPAELDAFAGANRVPVGSPFDPETLGACR